MLDVQELASKSAACSYCVAKCRKSQDQCCLLASTDNIGLGLHFCKSRCSILLASIWYNSVQNSWYEHFSVTPQLHSSRLYYKSVPHIRTVHVQPWSTFTFSVAAQTYDAYIYTWSRQFNFLQIWSRNFCGELGKKLKPCICEVWSHCCSSTMWFCAWKRNINNIR